MNRFELFNSMITRTLISIMHNGSTLTGYVNGIALEDGSGHCFNVRMYIPNIKEYITIFMKG